MSLVKLEKTSNYLIINIKFNNIIDYSKLKNIIFNLLNYYCEYIRWDLYQILDPNNSSIYYYISNYTYINIERIDYIITKLIKNNNINILITYGCYDEKEFKKGLNKYKNKHIISFYKKKNNWNYICMHEKNICSKNNNCNNLL